MTKSANTCTYIVHVTQKPCRFVRRISNLFGAFHAKQVNLTMKNVIRLLYVYAAVVKTRQLFTVLTTSETGFSVRLINESVFTIFAIFTVTRNLYSTTRRKVFFLLLIIALSYLQFNNQKLLKGDLDKIKVE